MNGKHFATIILTSLLVATIFGSATVLAPSSPSTRAPLSVLAYYEGAYHIPEPLDVATSKIVPNTHIEADGPVFFSVSVRVAFSGPDDLVVIEKKIGSKPERLLEIAYSDEDLQTITFGSDSMQMELMTDNILTWLYWSITVAGNVGTTLTIVE